MAGIDHRYIKIIGDELEIKLLTTSILLRLHFHRINHKT